MRTRGFTLPELLVAVALLGIVSIMAWRGVDGLQRTVQHREVATARWREVARGLDKVVIDLRQVTVHPLSIDQQPPSAWHGQPGQDGDTLQFLRAPLIDGQPLQRMGYRRRDGRLEMLLWPAGSAADAPPQAEPLIEAVAGFEVRFLGGDLRWHDVWPLKQLDPVPRAIAVRIALAEGGQLERVVALP